MSCTVEMTEKANTLKCLTVDGRLKEKNNNTGDGEFQSADLLRLKDLG